MLHGGIRVTRVSSARICVSLGAADEKFTLALGWMDGSGAVCLPARPLSSANPPNQVVNQNRDSLLFNLQNDMLMAHREISLCAAKAHHLGRE